VSVSRAGKTGGTAGGSAGGATGTAACRWPWLPFVDLALAMALVPGFLLGALTAAAPVLPVDTGAWYAAARQAHGHAQLMGWGGAMILGVGLNFLPRFRGAGLPPPGRVRLLFAAFAAGLSLRVLAQPLAALAVPGGGPRGAGPWPALLRGATAAGALLEAAAVAGLVALLVTTLRQGPPLARKRAFAEMLPFLAAAAGGLLLAVGAWAWGSIGMEGPGGILVRARWDLLAVHAAVLVLVPAISVGTSVRLFPLYLRLEPARPGWARASALFFLAALAALVLSVPLGGGTWFYGAGAACSGAGLLAGCAAVRVFERRRAFPGDQGRYRAWADPVAVGAVTAYGWGVLGALGALLYALDRWPAARSPWPRVGFDLVVHLLGAGFMTLLIIGVGAVLLPGFGGGKPGSRALLWTAVLLANAAAALRVVPGLMSAAAGSAPPWTLPVTAWAGVLGVAAAGVFTLYLRSSWPRPTGRVLTSP